MYVTNYNFFFSFWQINQNHAKYFGILLKEKYDSKSLKNGFQSLKSGDQTIGRYLEDANDLLLEDERYLFYLAKYELKHPGGINRMYFHFTSFINELTYTCQFCRSFLQIFDLILALVWFQFLKILCRLTKLISLYFCDFHVAFEISRFSLLRVERKNAFLYIFNFRSQAKSPARRRVQGGSNQKVEFLWCFPW